MENSIWNDYPLTSGDSPTHISLGSLHVWMQRKNEEIWITHIRDPDSQGMASSDKQELPALDNSSWARWAHESVEESLKVTPVFPNLPVVVSSEFPLTISPGNRIQIFTRIPVWVRIAFNKSDYILTEIPSVLLSRTWFGSPLEGELCYWATTKARRSLSELENKPFVINCPIWITNKSSDDLNFEKFCFRVERLGIHLVRSELWAGETTIVYHGDALNSDITMTGKLPSGLGKGKLLSDPRNPIQKSLATRTFKMLFDEPFISAR